MKREFIVLVMMSEEVRNLDIVIGWDYALSTMVLLRLETYFRL